MRRFAISGLIAFVLLAIAPAAAPAVTVQSSFKFDGGAVKQRISYRNGEAWYRATIRSKVAITSFGTSLEMQKRVGGHWKPTKLLGSGIAFIRPRKTIKLRPLELAVPAAALEGGYRFKGATELGNPLFLYLNR